MDSHLIFLSREICLFDIPLREYMIKYSATLYFDHTVYTRFVRFSDVPAFGVLAVLNNWTLQWENSMFPVSKELSLCTLYRYLLCVCMCVCVYVCMCLCSTYVCI